MPSGAQVTSHSHTSHDWFGWFELSHFRSLKTELSLRRIACVKYTLCSSVYITHPPVYCGGREYNKGVVPRDEIVCAMGVLSTRVHAQVTC